MTALRASAASLRSVAMAPATSVLTVIMRKPPVALGRQRGRRVDAGDHAPPLARRHHRGEGAVKGSPGLSMAGGRP